MALGREVVDLVGLRRLDDPRQARRIAHVAVVQDEAAILFLRVLVQVIDTFRIEQRSAPLDAMDDIALGQEEFRQVGTVLARDTRD